MRSAMRLTGVFAPSEPCGRRQESSNCPASIRKSTACSAGGMLGPLLVQLSELRAFDFAIEVRRAGVELGGILCTR
ncbi:hypothetical protein PSP20601_05327 [Pandoraea sputorum]|nr:hypothetical protein PSP20601_05327 [Pandoraea sputorum]